LQPPCAGFVVFPAHGKFTMKRNDRMNAEELVFLFVGWLMLAATSVVVAWLVASWLRQ
jgi:hypothetical protein